MSEASWLPRIPVGEWFEAVVGWLEDNLGALFDLINAVGTALDDALVAVLTWPPSWLVILIFTGIAFLAKGWKLALGTAIGFTVIAAMEEFTSTMQTMALVLLASAVSVLIAIPLGIACARNSAISAVVRPALDFMQTLPAFVYLIPAIFFFDIGPIPGIVATVIFALPPGVRLTELGIRGVDPELVEAGEAFGTAPGKILTGIQIPLAMPSIMAGVNQVIMLSLSMVVIAGMVGAPGLGAEVFSAVTRIQIGPGFEAGLAVVVLAVFLDRVTSVLGAKKTLSRRKSPVSA